MILEIIKNEFSLLKEFNKNVFVFINLKNGRKPSFNACENRTR